jgi:serine/threonine protein kinase
MPELSTGDVIDGRYKVLSRLGAGGMADVFLAEDLQLGRKIALKLLHRRFAEDPDFVERFRREAQAAAGLQHPNVVSVYDRGAYDGTYYIAMEYLPGRTLKQLIRQDAPLDPAQAIDLATQILRAARFAHRRGVIHRDLKPHNVIVDDGGHAKVTDFGIARAGASDMTETGSIMGTSQYLSPEQAQGLPVGATSDLYSVGIVLYEMLTGRVPFDAESPVTIALKHVSEAPTPPSRFNPNIPPELEQVILWTLNKNPHDRPTDADQLITVLEQVKDAITSRERGQRTASMAALGAIPPAPSRPIEPVPAPTTSTDLYAATAAYQAAEREWPDNALRSEYGDDNGNRGRDRDDGGTPWPWVIAVLIALLLIGGGVLAYLVTRPDKKVVPYVVLETLSQAQATLNSDGFNVNPVYETDSHSSGLVIRQFPFANEKVNAGSTVTLTVSTGPHAVGVPQVSGLSPSIAEKQLRAAGFKIAGVQRQNSASVPSGQVIGTVPGSGQSSTPGTPVTVLVSSGKAPVSVPSVVGDTQANAQNTLQQAGFHVNPQQQQSATVTPGNVISQTPAGSGSAPPGSTVTIVVAQAPANVNVPSVVGQTGISATSTLKAAGFKVVRQRQPTADPSQAGIVLSQSPSSGTAMKGSTVTIVTGRYKRAATGPTGSSGSTGSTGSTGTT